MKIISGDRIILRALLPNDANERYAGWMNDPFVNRFLEARFRKHDPKSLREYLEKTACDKNTVFLAIVIAASGQHIGNIKLELNGESAEVGIVIGERDCWGKGYAVEAICLLCDYARKELGVKTFTAGAYANNTASLRAFIKAGFREKRRGKKKCMIDGQCVEEYDEVRLEMN